MSELKKDAVQESVIDKSKTQGVSRRKFLKAAGAALVLVATGGIFQAYDNGVFSTGEGLAYEPWKDWRRKEEGPLNMVRAAILASNPHNTQAWLFHVTGNQIDLYVNKKRHHGAADPLMREMYIGAGCALENMLLAARAEGYTADFVIMPNTANDTHVAHIVLSPGKKDTSPLYNAIPNRHTNRYAYTSRKVKQEGLDSLTVLADDMDDVRVVWLTDQGDMKRFSNLTIEATKAFIEDQGQSKASYAWNRSDWGEVQRLRDGITLDAAGLPDLVLLAAKMLPESSRQQVDNAWLNSMQNTQLPTAAAFGLVVARNAFNKAQQVKGGMLWQRLHLQMTVDRLAAQPINVAAERRDREIQLGLDHSIGSNLSKIIGDEKWQVINPFRIGYPTREPNLSPRRGVKDALI
ncbi:MAG TPA: twin-arginine translocation signal domain-containing protein [Anaerolineae bacterium]|nr:twin-arginine translocation signal domain-containing protein [Anaerolineae bacterium]